MNTPAEGRLLETSIGVTSSLFTRGNIGGIKAPSITVGACRDNVTILAYRKEYTHTHTYALQTRTHDTAW